MVIDTFTQTWRYKGEGFTVDVVRWSDESIKPIPANLKGMIPEYHWNVYVWIYPKHRIFKMILNDSLFGYGVDIPLHCGTSYHQWGFDAKGEVTYKKIGSDYQHLGDDRFGEMSTKEQAYEIFQDADELIGFMKEQTTQEEDNGEIPTGVRRVLEGLPEEEREDRCASALEVSGEVSYTGRDYPGSQEIRGTLQNDL